MTKEPEMPKFRFLWEQRGFGKYFKFALDGKQECTIWQYLTEVYRYKYLQACMFGAISILFAILLAAGVYYQISNPVIYSNFILTFTLVFFTGTCILDTKHTRKQVMNYWEVAKKQDEEKRKGQAT